MNRAAIEQWAALAPALGFSGSGYFGHAAAELRRMLDEFGLRVPSVHTDLLTLETRMTELGEARKVFGHDYVVLPAIPIEERQTLDDYRRMAERFNRIGELAKREGMKFAYHNHGYGVLDLEAIVAKAKAVGVRHFFVEQDLVAEPEVALKRSWDYLRKLKR